MKTRPARERKKVKRGVSFFLLFFYTTRRQQTIPKFENQATEPISPNQGNNPRNKQRMG